MEVDGANGDGDGDGDEGSAPPVSVDLEVNARPQVEHIAAAVTKIAENGGSTALSAADPPQTVIMGVASHRAGTPDELEARLGGECLELEVAHDHEVDVARALAGSLITIRRTPTCCSARGAQPSAPRAPPNPRTPRGPRVPVSPGVRHSRPARAGCRGAVRGSGG